MKICKYCNKSYKKKTLTCGKGSCPGLRASETRKSVRHIAVKRYSSVEKSRDIEVILQCLGYYAKFREPNILTFEGGGVFTRQVLGKFLSRIKSIYSLDMEPKIIEDAKKEYKKVKSKKIKLINDELEHYLRSNKKDKYDFIWLDYCGNFTGKEKDIELLSKRLEKDYFFFITVLGAREKWLEKDENKLFTERRTNIIDTTVTKNIDAIMIYKHRYKTMVTYGYCSRDMYAQVIQQNIFDKKINKKEYQNKEEVIYYPQDVPSVINYFKTYKSLMEKEADYRKTIAKIQFTLIKNKYSSREEAEEKVEEIIEMNKVDISNEDSLIKDYIDLKEFYGEIFK